jgi:hypothetical protein
MEFKIKKSENPAIEVQLKNHHQSIFCWFENWISIQKDRLTSGLAQA